MTRRDAFVQAMIDIANDDSHGYDQGNRWGPDYDCSSMTYEAAYRAGYDVSRENPRYTGTIIEDFTAAGFRCDDFDGNLWDLEPGDVLLNESCHVAVYIGDGLLAEASGNEWGGITGGTPGDQTGWEIHICGVYNYPWTHVLTPPAESSGGGGGGGETPQPDPSTKLNGIDVSGWQSGIDTRNIWADFVIVKVSGGVGFVNDDYARQLDEAVAGGKLIGAYHYAQERGYKGSAIEEADFFVDCVSPWIGRAVLALDWEADAVDLGPGWALEWLSRVYERTGIRPMFYSYNSCVNGWDWSAVAENYPLWNAGYYAYGTTLWGYNPDAPLKGGTGAWSNGAAIYQYTSEGRLDGWGGNLDFNVFYGGASLWEAYATGHEEDDVSAKDVWEYDWEGTAPGGNMYNTVVDLHRKVEDMPRKIWDYIIDGTPAWAREYGTDYAANGANNKLEETLPQILAKLDSIEKRLDKIEAGK